MRLVFMGTPKFAVAPLRNLVLNNYEVAAVYTKKDKLAGRGQELSFSAVKEAALALGLRVAQPGSLRKPEAVAELASLAPDVIVVAAFGQILPPQVLQLPRFGCINIHPSLLPRHRGAAPVVSTILSGDAWAGASLMQMDEGLDTGPIIAQSQVLVRGEDTAETLAEKLSLISADMLVDILPRWVKGELTAKPQNNSLSTYFKPIAKEAGEIDWNLPAVDIWRQVRAFQPWPGSFTRYNDKTFKILEAYPCPENDSLTIDESTREGICGVTNSDDCLKLNCRGLFACWTTLEPVSYSLSEMRKNGTLQPGKIIHGKEQTDFRVVTGSGLLEVTRVQIEGKKPMSAADFLRGQRGFIGSVLPS
jgi:methionyl-tRNA formyltransferase